MSVIIDSRAYLTANLNLMNDDLELSAVRKIEGNPLKNHDAVLLVKQEDGNWRGFMWKGDKLVQSRQADPNTVMQMLITHG